jgi:hypothetical protein
MGYTHYWDRSSVLPRQQFLAAADDCRRLCDALKIPLGDAKGEGLPIFNTDTLCFNGRVDTGGWEPFRVDRVRRLRDAREPHVGSWWSSFCKTNRLPYDLCVQGCLIVLSHHFTKSHFRVSSDGDSQDWHNARDACQRALGYGIDWGEEKLAPVPPSQQG